MSHRGCTLSAYLFCGVVAVAVAGEAGAQQASTTPVGELQEIVVTATRTEQALSKVPVSLSAFTQEALDDQGVKSVDDLTRLTPGVNLSRGGSTTTTSTNISIRGIRSTAGAATTGIYIDDTPIQTRGVGYSSGNSYPIIFDLQRVEVLRGPQGTLFGAGSEGGTVRFITAQPDMSSFTGYARSEVSFTEGGDPSYEAGVAAGGPLVEDRLGFRASAFYRKTAGYIDHIEHTDGSVLERNANDQDATTLRAALTWAPTDTLSITPSIHFQQVRIDANDLVWADAPGGHEFANGFELQTPDRDRFFLPSLLIQWELPWARLTSNTAYFDRDQKGTADYSTIVPSLLGGVPFVPGLPHFQAPVHNTNVQRNFTQELRLQSLDPDARLTWLVGAFYSNARQNARELIEAPDLGQVTQIFFGAPVSAVFGQDLIDGRYVLDGVDHTQDEQLALFGEAQYAITDRLKAIAGVRVAQTEFHFTNTQSGPSNGPTNSSSAGSQKETPVTPRFGLSYQADPRNLYYVTVSKGYRLGGATPPVSTFRCGEDLADLGMTSAPSSYDSDSVWSYEIGAKNRVLDNRLQISTSAFYIQWLDIQQAIHLPRCGIDFTSNIGEAVSKGFDLQLSAQVTDHLTLDAAVGYTHASFSKSTYGGVVDPATGQRAVIVAKGDRISGPPWLATFAGQYSFDAFGGNPAFVRLDYEHHSANVDRNPLASGYDPAIPTLGSTQQVNLRMGATIADLDISLFAINLLNEDEWLSYGHDVAGSPLFYGMRMRPRTVGVSVARRF